MGKGKVGRKSSRSKKGKKKNAATGAQSSYMTRTQAVKRLQLTLRDFRKLCILKGIFPRDPQKKSKLKGGDKTYYYTKDISFLAHDPLIGIFRQFKTWRKKVARAKGRKETATLARLKANKPTYTLDHVVRERYPTFTDALRDMDDALCMIHLFANVPQTPKVKINRIENCNRLVNEFKAYVIASRSLRKVFLSIKGIYYQADIQGQTVTWLVPYNFAQSLPTDVDYSVMLTFLEFYETFMGFINFKLYHSLGFIYPPRVDRRKDASGEIVDAVVLQTTQAAASKQKFAKPSNNAKSKARLSTLKSKIAQLTNKAADEDGEDNAPEETEAANDEEMKEVFAEENEEEGEKTTDDDDFLNLFSKCRFFLSREVPKASLEFVIKAFGGSVSWEENPIIPESDPSITHQVVDRSVLREVHPGREYIQPQYIYDCINARVLLPTEDYLPNAKLPPHLSPFVEDTREGYIPAQRERLNRMIAAVRGTTEEEERLAESGNDEEDDEEAFSDDEAEEAARLEAEYEKEMEAEAAGESYSSFVEKEGKDRAVEAKKKAAAKKRKQEEEEKKEKEFSAMMIPSRKKKRLYQRIDYTEKKKEAEVDKLQAKRQRLEAEGITTSTGAAVVEGTGAAITKAISNKKRKK